MHAIAAIVSLGAALGASVAPSQKISAEALRADLDAIVDLHERVCPAPYLRTSRESILAARDRLKSSIDAPMTKRQFLPLAMELQAAYGVDHMALWVPQDEVRAALTAGAKVLPFRAAPDGDELEIIAVSRSVSVIEPGDRIIRVDGRPARELIDRLERLVPGENPRYRSARIRNNFRSLAWALGVDPPLTIDVRRADGSMVGVSIDGIGADAGSEERRAPTGAAPNASATGAAPNAGATGTAPNAKAPTTEVLVDEPPFRCSIVDGDIARIDFPDMNRALKDRWIAFLDRAFKAIGERGCKGVIVDIRRNGGGDSGLGDILLARLTSKPYRLAGGVQIGSYGERSVSRQSAKPFARERISPGFDGPACLLIGVGTFSSAEMLADGARTYDLMVTIGEPTGGSPTSLGELGSHTLAGSGLAVPYCQKRFIRANGDENDSGPVTPHIPVPESTESDAPLARAIAEIRARAAAPAK